MIAAVESYEGWGIRVTKPVMNEMDAAYCAWEDGHPHNIDPYESFVAGWHASKADSHAHKVVVEYDLAPALIESALHDKLLDLGYVRTKRTTE